MSLSTGTRLGPYEILGPIGAGGMGEVYRAHDTKLKRDVALKVLPEVFAGDAERMARFEREAQVLASLNHPNIAAIYGVEERAIVMELVEGETLARPLPIKTALDYARQIAAALEAAHEKGIVHRDLKPANVKITPDGVAKVLDFGLAKLTEDPAPSNASNSPTLTMSPTRLGMILGTAAYMAPEQARGAVVDKRADIWAFGAVLYEMLAGRPAFAGESTSDILAGVLRAEPDWSALPAETPQRIRKLLRRCLERDRKLRLRDIGEARIAIDAPEEEVAAQPAPSRRWIPWAAAGVLAIASAVLAVAWLRPPAPVPRPVMRWTTTLPNAAALPGALLSPDGLHLVYQGTAFGSTVPQLLVRPMDQLEAKPISGTEDEGLFSRFFSPDGHWIGYWARGSRLLRRVPVTGGASITICETRVFHGGSWGPDDTIIFGDASGGLSQIPAAGGKTQVLTTPDSNKGETIYAGPQFLPGGKAVLFSISTGPLWDDARIGVLNLRTGEKRVLLEGGANARYAPTGHLIYARAGSLFAVLFDPDRLQVNGPPVPVLEGVLWIPRMGFADYSFSRSGTLVYVPDSVQEAHRTMVWVNRKGEAEALPAPPRAYANPSVSPDGQRIAVNIGSGARLNQYDIWIYELARGALTRLTVGPRLNFAPVWTPDGKRVTFRSVTQGGFNISWVLADRSGGPEQLFASEHGATPGSWSPDGRSLAFEQGLQGKTETWVLQGAGDAGAGERKARLLVPTNSLVPQISPDGLWIAYASDESGTYQVYVQPFPGPGGRTQVSTDGGHFPRWARNGRELFYRNGDKMMAVAIETKPAFRAGRPTFLFKGSYETSPPGIQPGAGYDVSADGKRFLMIKAGSEQPATTQLQVVQDWFEELKRRVPTGSK